MNFKVVKRETIFHGKVFDVNVDEIEYNGTGNKASRQVAIHPGGAVVLPVTNDGKIVFVTQYRYPHNEVLLELPAGKLEKGEDPFLCASRELTEETGYTSDKITKLGKIYTTPGFCNEILYIYLAEDIIPGIHAREEGEEGMEIVELTADEVDDKIRSGKIVDAKTICGIAYYKLKSGY
ncbi:MAG: NUDIX hydrolase [Ignavibacteriae bacterium HGW-Ignavibacteriae-3]|nr:MAG: NUDIX hydrolase [Ignavibacteriae bacterium HGW-Ignavibacteriae-3]